ncbi:hypothetical protein pipiens_005662, partial [Culex pipiens pipiens]
ETGPGQTVVEFRLKLLVALEKRNIVAPRQIATVSISEELFESGFAGTGFSSGQTSPEGARFRRPECMTQSVMESVERKDQDLERNDSGGKNRSESGSLQVVRVSEFHEVIDSAAVLLQVLGAHDSMEARSMFIEGFLKKENFQDEDE